MPFARAHSKQKRPCSIATAHVSASRAFSPFSLLPACHLCFLLLQASPRSGGGGVSVPQATVVSCRLSDRPLLCVARPRPRGIGQQGVAAQQQQGGHGTWQGRLLARLYLYRICLYSSYTLICVSQHRQVSHSRRGAKAGPEMGSPPCSVTLIGLKRVA